MHGMLYRDSFGGQGCGSLSSHLHLPRGHFRCGRAAIPLGSRAALGAAGALCRALGGLSHMFLRCDTARLLNQTRDASCQHTEAVWSAKETRHLQHHAHNTIHEHAINREHDVSRCHCLAMHNWCGQQQRTSGVWMGASFWGEPD